MTGGEQSGRRILVTGGSGSGKSAYAESLVADADRMTYVAPGPVPDPGRDREWAARVAAHRERRPGHWTTIETADVPAAVRAAAGPVLVDCLGTWLTAVIDDLGVWDRPLAEWRADVDAEIGRLVSAWRETTDLAVAVTNEVGWGLVSEHRSGRVFTELLGRVNVAVATASDEVVLVVAGRPLRI